MKIIGAVTFLVFFTSASLAFSSNVISPDEAADKVNQFKTVHAVFSAAKARPDGICLEALVKPYAGAGEVVFRVYISSSDYRSFPENPASYYLGKTVEVAGKIKLDNDEVPFMNITAGRNIKVIGEKIEKKKNAATPKLVSWNNLAPHVGKTVMLQGTLKFFEIKEGGGRILGFKRNAVAAIIQAPDVLCVESGIMPPLPKLNSKQSLKAPASAEGLLVNKKLRLTGEIEIVDGSPVMLIRSPKQIEICN
jgi:hypothetical protein